MRSSFFALVLSILLAGSAYAQKSALADSITKRISDSLRWEALKKTAMFPLIKNSEESAVYPVPLVTEKADPSMKYKLMFHMVIWSRDSAGKTKLNEGLAEIGRIINLHVAAGVPKENLELAIIINGSAMNVYLKNDVYLKKFKTNNPNLDILEQFTDLKTSLIACGQSEVYRNISPDDFISGVKTSFSAKVAISTYQLKGYVLYEIEEDK